MVQGQDHVANPLFLRDVTSLIDAIKPQNSASFWGIAPVAPVHLGYDSLIVAQKEMVRLGLRHTVLIADYHAMLTHGLSISEISERATYYENYLRHCCGLSASYIRGTSFQTRPQYIESLYSAMSSLPVSTVRESLSQVSKKDGADKSMVSTYMYGLMQCLDCCYLGSEVVFAEQGQAKIYRLLDAFNGEVISNAKMHRHVGDVGAPQKPVAFIYAPTGHDIKGKPLNQSRAQDRISIHESEATLKSKIAAMFAAPAGQDIPQGRVNAILEYFKFSVFPWQSGAVRIVDINRRQQEYLDFDHFLADYNAGKLSPNDCKCTLHTSLWDRLSKIQATLGISICSWIDMNKARGERQ